MAITGAMADRILVKILERGLVRKVDATPSIDVAAGAWGDDELTPAEVAYLTELLDDPDEGVVEAAMAWPSNGEMIADMFRLDYLADDITTLDPTYGKGNWWTVRRPHHLVAHDLDPAKSPTGEPVSFLELPYRTGQFARSVYDPPYVCPGGRATSTVQGMLDSYGLLEAPRTPRALQEELINPGLTEVARVTNGLILVKVQNYNWGDALWPGVAETLRHAYYLDLALEAQFEHLGDAGPQPTHTITKAPDPGTVLFPLEDIAKKRAVRRARHTHSTLLVFRTPNRPATEAMI